MQAIKALALSLALSAAAWGQSSSGAVDCTPDFVTEASSRCTTGVSPPCVLVYWGIDGMPARCQLDNGVLSWWVGVGTTGTTIDPSTGQLLVTYTWQPLVAPQPPSGFTVL